MLTLPGIAGIILTIGLAIDANVLIYERLREELAAGKALRPAIEGAYSKAFSSIFDANVTTLITSVILFIYAAGPVKGFAVALTVGIVASLFSALVVTRNGFGWATERFGLAAGPHAALLREPALRLHGQGARVHARLHWWCFCLSAGGLRLCAAKKNFGIDFNGGDRTVLTANRALNVGRGAQRPCKASASRKPPSRTSDVNGKPALSILSPVETGPQHPAGRWSKAFPDADVKLGAIRQDRRTRRRATRHRNRSTRCFLECWRSWFTCRCGLNSPSRSVPSSRCCTTCSSPWACSRCSDGSFRW